MVVPNPVYDPYKTHKCEKLPSSAIQVPLGLGMIGVSRSIMMYPVAASAVRLGGKRTPPIRPLRPLRSGLALRSPERQWRKRATPARRQRPPSRCCPDRDIVDTHVVFHDAWRPRCSCSTWKPGFPVRENTSESCHVLNVLRSFLIRVEKGGAHQVGVLQRLEHATMQRNYWTNDFTL